MANPGDLFKAAEDGNLELLKQFAVNAGGAERFRIVCESMKGYEGQRIIHCAAAAGKTQICKYLIESVKVNINEKTEQGDTPLLLATEMEHIPAATYLLNHGADASASNIKGTTALHHVAFKGNEKFIKLLISQGADIEADSDFGTPLQRATTSGKKKAVRILLDHKTNPNRTLPISMSPVMLSILAQSFDCLDMLLKAGADINALSLGLLPLAFAASESENEFIKVLLKAGADPNLVGSTGMTPLEYAAMSCNYEGSCYYFRVLLAFHLPDWSFREIMSHMHPSSTFSPFANVPNRPVLHFEITNLFPQLPSDLNVLILPHYF